METGTPSELATSEMPVSDNAEGEATPVPPPVASFPPYPPYTTEPAPPSVADTIIAGRGLRLQHKSMPRKPVRPPPKPARPRGPKATDVKMTKRAMYAHTRCLRRHGAILTDRLERMAKPLRRNIIYLWREHAHTLPPETIARLRSMLDADEPFKPDQAYEYFVNLKKTKKKTAATAGVNEIKKDVLAMVGEKRFVWARNATVAFARGIQQRLSRPGRYALADGMLRLSNIILDDICGYMHMRTPSRRSMNPKAKFMMEMSDKVAVWIDEILSESDDRMLMMDFDEDEDVLRPDGAGDASFTDHFLDMMGDGSGGVGSGRRPLLLKSKPAHEKFHGVMKEAFQILTDTMDKKGNENLLSHGKFDQTFRQGADALKQAPDLEASNYNTSLASDVNKKLSAATNDVTPANIAPAMKEMVEIGSNFLAQNAEENKEKGPAFKLLVNAMRSRPSEKLYQNGKVERTNAEAAKELEKARSLEVDHDDPNLSQSLYTKMANLVANTTPGELKKDMADTLDVSSKYLSQKAVDEAERGPAFDLLIKELDKNGDETFSDDPALNTKNAAAYALATAPGLTRVPPDPSTAPKFKEALHKAVDAATPKQMQPEMKEVIERSGNYLSAFVRDRGAAIQNLLGMMKSKPKHVFAKRNDYTMDYKTGAEEIENAPTLVPYLPVKDIAEEGKKHLTKDMKKVTPPELKAPMQAAIQDVSKYLSQPVALRSGAAGERYPMNLLAAVKKSLGTRPLYKHKSYGQSYAQAADELQHAGPLESPQSASQENLEDNNKSVENLQHEIVSEMERGVPTRVAPSIAEGLNPTMKKAAKHLAKVGSEKGGAMEYLIDLMKEKGNALLAKLQGYNQSYTDGAKRIEDAPSLKRDKVDKGAYEDVKGKLNALAAEKPANKKLAEHLPELVDETAKYLAAPLPETQAEKREVLANLLGREEDKTLEEEGIYKMTYKEGGEEIKKSPVGVTKAHDEAKKKEIIKKVEAVIPDKKMKELLKEPTQEGAAHLADVIEGRGEAIKVIHDELKKEKDKEFIEVGEFKKTHEQAADMLAEAKKFGAEKPSPVILDKVEHQVSSLPKDIPSDKPMAKKHMEDATKIAAKYIASAATKESGLDAKQLAELDESGFNDDVKAAAAARKSGKSTGADGKGIGGIGADGKSIGGVGADGKSIGVVGADGKVVGGIGADGKGSGGIGADGKGVGGVGADGKGGGGIDADGKIIGGVSADGKGLGGIGADGMSIGGVGADGKGVGGIGADGKSVGGIGADGKSIGAVGADGKSIGGVGADGKSIGGVGADGMGVGGIDADGKSIGGVGADGKGVGGIGADGQGAGGVGADGKGARGFGADGKGGGSIGADGKSTGGVGADGKGVGGVGADGMGAYGTAGADGTGAYGMAGTGGTGSESAGADGTAAGGMGVGGVDVGGEGVKRAGGGGAGAEGTGAEGTDEEGTDAQRDGKRGGGKKGGGKGGVGKGGRSLGPGGVGSAFEYDPGDAGPIFGETEEQRRRRLAEAEVHRKYEEEERMRLGDKEYYRRQAEKRKREMEAGVAGTGKYRGGALGADYDPEHETALDILHNELRRHGTEVFYQQPQTGLTHRQASDWIAMPVPLRVDKTVKDSGDTTRLYKKFERKLSALVNNVTPEELYDSMQDVIIESARRLSEFFVSTNYKALVHEALISEMQKRGNEILTEVDGAAETFFFAAQRLKKSKTMDIHEPCYQVAHQLTKKLEDMIRCRSMARKLTATMKDHVKEAANFLSAQVTKPDDQIEAYIALLGEMEAAGDSMLIEGDIPKSYKEAAAYLRQLTSFEDLIARPNSSLQATIQDKLKSLMSNVTPSGYSQTVMDTVIAESAGLLVSSIMLQGAKTEALNLLVQEMEKMGDGVLLRHGPIRKSFTEGADMLRGKNAGELGVTGPDPVVSRKIQIKLNNLMQSNYSDMYHALMDDVIEDATSYLAVHFLQPQVIKVCKCMKNVFVQCELWCDEILRRVARPCCMCSRHVSAQALQDLAPAQRLRITPGSSLVFAPGLEISLTTCPSKQKPPNRTEPQKECPAAHPTPGCLQSATTSYLLYSTSTNKRFGYESIRHMSSSCSDSPACLSSPLQLSKHSSPFKTLLEDIHSDNIQLMQEERLIEQQQYMEPEKHQGPEAASPSFYTPDSIYLSETSQGTKSSPSYPASPMRMYANVQLPGSPPKIQIKLITQAKSGYSSLNYSTGTPIISTDQMADWHAMMVSLMWNVQAWRDWIQENIDRALVYRHNPNTSGAVTEDNWSAFQRRLSTEGLQWRQYSMFSRQLTTRLALRYKDKEKNGNTKSSINVMSDNFVDGTILNEQIVSPVRATVKTKTYLECQEETMEIIDIFNRWTQWLTLAVKETDSLHHITGSDVPLHEMRWHHLKKKVEEYSNDWIKYNMYLKVSWEQKYSTMIADHLPSWKQPGPVWVVSACGAVPSGAVAAGVFDGEVIWVARTTHRCNVLPAALYPSKHCCLVYADGAVHRYTKYQVMCNAEVRWVAWRGGSIGGRAVRVSAGVHVGRVHYRGDHLLGAVHEPHYRCQVVIFGRPFAFNCYELLMLADGEGQ